MDLTTLTPAEVDAHLTTIHRESEKIIARIAGLHADVHRQAGDRKRYSGRTYSWGMTTADALAILALQTPDSGTLASLREQETALAAVTVDMGAVDAEYRRRPWTRFYAVQAGHVHRVAAGAYGVGCGSLRWNTRAGLWADLSGMDEAQAMTHFKQGAHVLCSKPSCFPNAPVAFRKQADPDLCPGSKTVDYPRDKTARMGYRYGNYGVCEHCGQRTTLTSTNALRSHKKPAA